MNLLQQYSIASVVCVCMLCSMAHGVYAVQVLEEDKALHLRTYNIGLQSWKDLAPALERSLAYATSFPPQDTAVQQGALRITWAMVVQSLHILQSLLPQLDAKPELLAQHFTWWHLAPGSHFTGYFSPIVPASRTRKLGYTVPLYRLPEEIAPELAHCLPTHTCPEEAFRRVIQPTTPYFSRAAIDLDGALHGRNLEMAWVQHPFDAYELMLEGSGLLAFDDGTTQAALFAGLNGNKGQSMAGYLIQHKILPRKDATMAGMRRWWDANLHKRRAFLEAATGYVFFRYGADKPRGTAGGELTPWVSMAVDDTVLPLGGILAYDVPVQGQRLRGLGFAHDTGSAIKHRRIDIYTGEGETAHKQALQIYNKGHIWLLLAKSPQQPSTYERVRE